MGPLTEGTPLADWVLKMLGKSRVVMEAPEAPVVHREPGRGCSLDLLARPSPEPAGPP